MPNWNHKKLLFTDEKVRDSFNEHYQMARVIELPNDASVNRGGLTDGNGEGNGSCDALWDYNFQKAREHYATAKEFFAADIDLSVDTLDFGQSKRVMGANEEWQWLLHLDLKSSFLAEDYVPKWHSSVPISPKDKLADQIMIELEALRPNVLYINTKRAEASITVLCRDEEKQVVLDYAYGVGKELYKREALSFEFSEQVKMLAKVVIYDIELKAIRDLVNID